MIIVVIPMAIYSFIMWFATFFLAKSIGANYGQAVAISFTAASNDFELAITVAVAIFGISSKQAFAAVVGPLIEVSVFIRLVNVAFRFREKVVSNAVDLTKD